MQGRGQYSHKKILLGEIKAAVVSKTASARNPFSIPVSQMVISIRKRVTVCRIAIGKNHVLFVCHVKGERRIAIIIVKVE